MFLNVFFFFFFFFFFLRDRVSLFSPGCPGIRSVDQAGFELTELLRPSESSLFVSFFGGHLS